MARKKHGKDQFPEEKNVPSGPRTELHLVFCRTTTTRHAGNPSTTGDGRGSLRGNPLITGDGRGSLRGNPLITDDGRESLQENLFTTSKFQVQARGMCCASDVACLFPPDARPPHHFQPAFVPDPPLLPPNTQVSPPPPPSNLPLLPAEPCSLHHLTHASRQGHSDT